MKMETQAVSSKRLSLAEAFAGLPDPRVAGRSKHDLVEMLVEDVGCAESLLGAEVPMTKGLRGAVKAFRGRQLAELRRLKAGRVVV